MKYSDTLSTERVILNVMKESVQIHLADLDLPVGNYEATVDTLPQLHNMARTMVMRLTKRTATENLDMIELEVPANWWEHFKEEHFPLWLERWFPIKYTKHQWSVKAYYDKVALPEYSPHVVFQKLTNIPDTDF